MVWARVAISCLWIQVAYLPVLVLSIVYRLQALPWHSQEPTRGQADRCQTDRFRYLLDSAEFWLTAQSQRPSSGFVAKRIEPPGKPPVAGLVVDMKTSIEPREHMCYP